MTPREPDRFEEKAETLLFDMGLNVEMVEFEGDRDRLAAALRQAADEALERAAQEPPPRCAGCRRETEPVPDGIRNEARLYGHRWWCPACGQAVCAWWTPAAAPAAETDAPNGPVCGCGRPSRYESGWCGETSCFANVAPPSEPGEPSLLPRVLAALEVAAWRFDHSEFRYKSDGLRALAAELRRYIADQPAAGAPEESPK